MKSYGAHLRRLRERSGFGLVAVAEQLRKMGLDVSNTNVSRWENGYNSPTLEEFLALCRIYGVRDIVAVFAELNDDACEIDLNREGLQALDAYKDLLVGSGWYAKRPADRVELEMDEPPASSNVNLTSFRVPPPVPAGQTRKRRIPMFKIGASAGAGNDIHDAEYEFIEIDDDVPQEASFAVHVDGDSMEPVLKNGELLYVHSQPSVDDGDVAVVSLNGTTFVKQFRHAPNGTWLVSANAQYRPMMIEEYDSVQIHGKVISPKIRTRFNELRRT